MSKITMIKKDAKATIEVGTGVLECLQKLLIFIVDGKTQEELNSFSQQSEQHKSVQDKYDQEWMDHFKIITVLAAAIEKQFIDSKQVEEVEVPDIDTNLI